MNGLHVITFVCIENECVKDDVGLPVVSVWSKRPKGERRGSNAESSSIFRPLPSGLARWEAKALEPRNPFDISISPML